MKTTLKNIFKPLNKMGEIKSQYEDLIEPMVENTAIDRIRGKIPEEHKLKNGSLLHANIESIVNTETAIGRKLDEIDGINKFELSDKCNKYDKQFKESFEQWKVNIPDQNQVERVKKELSAMLGNYSWLLKNFENDMCHADELKQSIELEKNTTKFLFQNILGKRHEEKQLENADKLAKKLATIQTSETRLLELLGAIKNMQNEVNKERRKWAELLIGMRDTLKSEPKPVKPNVTPAKGSKKPVKPIGKPAKGSSSGSSSSSNKSKIRNKNKK